MTNILPKERIERSILLIRGHRVMLDAVLAELYGVETRVLLQAVSRNPKRFPEDFMFQLSKEEYEFLRSQIVISKGKRGSRMLAMPGKTRIEFISTFREFSKRVHSRLE